MPRYSYPHTIENGAGERITFLRRLRGATGDRLEGTNSAAPGVGPGMHIHHYLDEVFTVEEGRIGYQRLGEPERFAGAGETVSFGAGVPHRFWNAGDGELRCTAYMEPADNAEYIVTELFASMRRRGGGRPALLDVAYLALRYRTEYTIVQVPAALQRLAFPVLVAIGRLLGKYERYADAPPAVRR